MKYTPGEPGTGKKNESAQDNSQQQEVDLARRIKLPVAVEGNKSLLSRADATRSLNGPKWKVKVGRSRGAVTQVRCVQKEKDERQ